VRKFYKVIVNHPKTIIAAFVATFIVCLICKQMVSVNYDMNDYLPENCPSTVSLTVMESEFEGGIPNARVMIYDVTIPQALLYKEKLSKIGGVTDVVWLDDAADLTQPLEIMDTETVETYYKDNAALFTVTIEENSRIEAVGAIRNLIGEENAMTGAAASSAVATENTVKEIQKIAVIAILFILFVLTLTTSSWTEPLIVLAGLGVAVIINAGSNLIFGEISFVTNAAGNILQLGVSLDYSVFLIHRFVECRKENPDVKTAMVDALCKSTSSILSSGLTTVIGFVALTLMQFRIGSDLGLALAKGIAISLITVFVFMPALIMVTYKLLDKTQHKPILPSFNRFGKFVYRIMIPCVVVFLIIIAPAYLASNSNDFYYGASHLFSEQTQLGADTAAIEDVFGKRDTYVLLVPNERVATQKELSDELKTLRQVSSIISYADLVGIEIPMEYLDESTLSKLVSEHYSRMVISVNAAYEGEETFYLIEEVRSIANKYYPDSFYLAGEGVSTYDLMNTVKSDMLKVNLVAIAAVFLVLLLTMKSVSLPVILVLGIETAIWINLSVPYFENSPIFYIAYLIISSIQLGATVDYAILFTERYKESRETMDKKQSVSSTISAVTVSILTSGIVLTVVGFLLGIISSNRLLSQLGFFLGKGTLCSLAIVLFVLPGLLYIFDGLIKRTTLGSDFLSKYLKQLKGGFKK
jgi:predicted RND superfamily exporter protein